MSKKLSDRALLVLMAIRDRCNWPKCDHYWLPGRDRGMDDRVDELDLYVNIGGGGDAAILRSLKAAGLILRPRPSGNSTEWPSEYIYVITEDGVLAVEKAREAGRLQPFIDDMERRRRSLEEEFSEE